jgi:hypothetical protein
MGRVYKTARGKNLDMASLMARHEMTRAVSNVHAINSRGDEIDTQGRIVKPNTQRVADSYASQVGTSGAILQERPEHPNISRSANPNAPLSPKQKRELAALESGQIKEKSVAVNETATPLLDKLVEEAKPEAVTTPVVQANSLPDPVSEDTVVAPIEQEIAPFPIDEPEKFEMKSANEAPDSFGAEGELHPEEAELADLEDDFDIEAIKKAALENVVSTPKATKKKGKK